MSSFDPVCQYAYVLGFEPNPLLLPCQHSPCFFFVRVCVFVEVHVQLALSDPFSSGLHCQIHSFLCGGALHSEFAFFRPLACVWVCLCHCVGQATHLCVEVFLRLAFLQSCVWMCFCFHGGLAQGVELETHNRKQRSMLKPPQGKTKFKLESGLLLHTCIGFNL